MYCNNNSSHNTFNNIKPWEWLDRLLQIYENKSIINYIHTTNFSDTIDTPINEIESEVKKIMAQRNYDIEQINRSFNVEQADNWLKPQKSSIRNEKIIQNNQTIQQKPNTNSIKYIKIDKNDLTNIVYQNDVIDLNSSPKKHISWEDEENNKVKGGIQDNNIFKKFKLLPSMLSEDSDNISLTIKEETVNNDINYVNDINQMNETKTKIINIEEKIQKMTDKMENMETTLTEILKVLQKK